MSMQDPIGNMFTVIRNGQLAKLSSVTLMNSKLKVAIAQLLKNEGYIKNFSAVQEDNKNFLVIDLKYFNGKAVISMIKRVSRPGFRIYKKHDQLPKVMDGLGVAIISTSNGLVADYVARTKGIGGEVICYVK